MLLIIMLLIIMNCDYSDHCDSIPVNQLKVISYNKHVSACSMIHVVHNSSRSRPDVYNRKPSSHTHLDFDLNCESEAEAEAFW